VGQGKIVVLGTGGTIAGNAAQAYDSSRYVAAVHGIEALIAGLPSAELPRAQILSEQVVQIDSKDMDAEVWGRLLQRCQHWLAQPGVGGLVITHGTDTIEETAYFLHATLRPKLPVVLTCAMRPANALLADGPQNLLDALVVAEQVEAGAVMVVCGATVHAAQEVHKVHAWRLDPFSSGDEGPLAHVVHGELRQRRDWPQPVQAVTPALLKALEQASSWPRVEIVTSHAGADGALVDALLAAPMARPVRGLVVAGTGGGTVNRALEAALLRAQSSGVKVVRASRSCAGNVRAQPDQRLPLAEGLTPAKARIALMLDLMSA
jgi:L-asparaginase